MNSLFNMVNESQVMQIEKELVSLEILFIDNIEYILARIKELYLKFGECGKDLPNKDGQISEMVLVNLKTPGI